MTITVGLRGRTVDRAGFSATAAVSSVGRKYFYLEGDRRKRRFCIQESPPGSSRHSCEDSAWTFFLSDPDGYRVKEIRRTLEADLRRIAQKCDLSRLTNEQLETIIQTLKGEVVIESPPTP